MITQQTAYDIAVAYQEIERAEKLLAEVEKELKNDRWDRGDMRDAFGRRVDGLQLGVPSGNNGQRLFNVPWALAKPVIQAHIASERAILDALNVKAQIEATAARLAQPASDEEVDA